mmetsp:Transcript_9370/g.18269  ORF Transcript_9370/g.18269 Transcript_9370/m.18269 type:complete len:309 (+) Transcript_9370:2053-2979(+)
MTDGSVLESFHASEAFAILKMPQYNFIRGLTPQQYQALRYMIIEMILITDLEHHRQFISDFEAKWKETAAKLSIPEERLNSTQSTNTNATAESAPIGKINEESEMSAKGQAEMDAKILRPRTDPQGINDDARKIIEEMCKEAEGRLMIMKLLIKCADINHPSRPLPLHKKWCALIQEEFFNQGDQEADLGLAKSRGMDRKTSTPQAIAKGNVGFIKFIVNPLFDIMKTRIRNPQFSRNITNNLGHWHKIANKSGSPSAPKELSPKSFALRKKIGLRFNPRRRHASSPVNSPLQKPRSTASRRSNNPIT